MWEIALLRVNTCTSVSAFVTFGLGSVWKHCFLCPLPPRGLSLLPRFQLLGRMSAYLRCFEHNHLESEIFILFIFEVKLNITPKCIKSVHLFSYDMGIDKEILNVVCIGEDGWERWNLLYFIVLINTIQRKILTPKLICKNLFLLLFVLAMCIDYDNI